MRHLSGLMAVFCLLSLATISWSFSGPKSGFDISLNATSVVELAPTNTITFSMILGGATAQVGTHTIKLSGPKGEIGTFSVICTLVNGAPVLGAVTPATLPKTLAQLEIIAPGSYTFTASYMEDGKPKTSTTTVWVGSLAKLEYQVGTTWKEVNGTLYVLKDSTLTLRAVSVVPNAPFPTGYPIWGGSAGAVGTGSQTSVMPTALGNQTVTAECGNTLTANLVVYELTPIATPSDNFAGRSLTDYGLQEEVSLNYSTNPALLITQIGGLSWDCADGTVIQWTTNVGTGYYTASSTACTATLKLKIMDGPSKDAFRTLTRTIVAPNSGSLIADTTQGVYHKKDWVSGVFHGAMYLAPKTVSFKKIFFIEDTCPATATGLFSPYNSAMHSRCATYSRISGGNSADGSRVGDISTFDEVGEHPGCRLDISGPPHQYVQFPTLGAFTTPPDGVFVGDFSWPIPWNYSTDQITDSGTITIATHHQTSNNYGYYTISKGGAGPIPTNFADPDSSIKVASPAFSLPTGIYTVPQTVTISTSTPNATIYYTTDGTTPYSNPALQYTGTISINATQTLNAIAILGGSVANSDVVTAVYTIQP